MKSAVSYFSVSLPLIRENLRRYWAIPALAFSVYFLSGIFPILMRYSDLENDYYFIRTLLMNHHPGFMAVHLLAPVIAAAAVFRYLQTTASATSLHAMPFTRAKLFNSSVLSGLILSLIPILFTGLILLLIAKPTYPPARYISETIRYDCFTHANVLTWMWQSLIIILVVYAIAVFAGLVTGNSLMHIFTGLGFNFLIPSLCGVFTTYCDQYLYGFVTSSDWNAGIMSLSPYLNAVTAEGAFSWHKYALYILNALALFVISMILYYKRRLERTADSLVFTFMIPVITYLTAFFGMTLIGLYFDVTGPDGNIYIGLITGAVIFFTVGNMIVKKTFRIFDRKTAKSFCVYVLLAAVFVTSFTLDITGFEKRLPATGSVTAARILNNHPSVFPPGSGFTPIDDVTLSTEDNIEAIREFHKSMIDTRGENEDEVYTSNKYYTWFNLEYDTKGFFDMYRYYSADYEQIKDNAALKKIFESEEYKSRFSLSEEHLTGLDSITSGHAYFNTGPVSLTVRGKNNMRELLECVDADFKAQTYEDAVSLRVPYTELILSYSDPASGAVTAAQRMAGEYITEQQMIGEKSIVITADCKNTIAWLKNNGYNDFRITPDLVSAIAVSETDNGETYMSAKMYPIPEAASSYTYDKPAMQSPFMDEVMITDKEQIAYMLETLETDMYREGAYQCRIIFEPRFLEEHRYPDYEALLFYDRETAPQFIKDLF